jgi:integrase
MATLRALEGSAARALEFLVLTAARTQEVIGAKWDEIDIEQRVWTVPAGRMKASKEHRVPLCARVVELLETLYREADNPFVFIGLRRAGLSRSAMVEVLKRPAAATSPCTALEVRSATGPPSVRPIRTT